jgi:hypothetical protein
MANPVGNPENLIPANERSLDEVRKNGQKGGIASGEARREKKLLSQIYADIISEDNGLPSGRDLKTVIKTIIDKGDNSSVSMIGKMGELTEGNKTRLADAEGGVIDTVMIINPITPTPEKNDN